MFERIAPEQHDTLDGVPEPSENPFLFGHADAKEFLASAYRAGKLPHALLLAGPVGIGKATFAFHFANHLLRYPLGAEAPAELARPEPSTPLFRQVAIGAHPAVVHLTRPYDEKNKRFKTVVDAEDIRSVGRFLSIKTHDGGYRVVIVDPADDMSPKAANALLKNLEEPPARTVFMLIAHAPGSLLPTIRSRCQLVRFGPLEPQALLSALAAAGMAPPADAAERDALVERAGGSVRGAILLTQYGGLEIAEATEKLARSQEFDALAAHRLADAVSARDAAIPFSLFNEHALVMLADAAVAAALRGDGAQAERLAQSFEESRVAVEETETYNLDRKQHALNMILRLQDNLRM